MSSDNFREKNLTIARELLPGETNECLIDLMNYLVSSIGLELDEEVLLDTFIPANNEKLRAKAREIIHNFKEDLATADRLLDVDNDNAKLKVLLIIASRKEELIVDVKEYIDRIFPDEDYVYYRDAIEIIGHYNATLLNCLDEDIENFQRTIKNAKDAQPASPVYEVVQAPAETSAKLPNFVDYETIIELMLSYKTVEERTRYFEQYSGNLPLLKILLLRKLYEIEKSLIQFNILTMNSIEFNETRSKYTRYRALLEQIKEYTNKEQAIEEETELKEEGPLGRVIFIPNGKNSTYIYEDVIGDIERREAAKQELNKILSRYFLRTNHVKPLKGYDNLCEYFNKKNQVRILFIKKGDYYFAASLFFKKDQRSLKTTGEYEEAIRRFMSKEEYMAENINTPNFEIEQQEYVQELDELLNQKSIVKEFK